MSEKRWVPEIVQNETFSDIALSIQNVIDRIATEYVDNLRFVITDLSSSNENKLRVRIFLKDKLGFITSKQPSFLSASQIVAQIKDDIRERNLDRVKFDIICESKTDSDNNLYTDFIIRER